MTRSARALAPWVFLALFVLLTGVLLPPLDFNDPTGFSGFFILLRRVSGDGPEPFSTYWAAAWAYSGDTSLPSAHHYHVKFSWGFVYPILATSYAAIAEAFRRLLPSDVNYLEIFVRAASAAVVCQWMAAAAAVSWALFRFRDDTLRARVATGAIVILLFDYLVQNNFAVFNGHQFLRYLQDGSLYAMTLPAARGTVSVLLGFYLAARLLETDERRRWIIPVSMAFHLPVATMGCAVLLGAEAVACLVRPPRHGSGRGRTLTRDLRMLGACTALGLLATATVGWTGYPAHEAGVLPGGVVWTVIGHAITHPSRLWLGPSAAVMLILAGGIRLVSRRQEAAGQALLVLAGLAGLAAIQFATGWAVTAGVLTWHDNPSVHSLLYVFDYASSAGLLGISLWLIARGGVRAAGVAVAVFCAVFFLTAATSRTALPVRLASRNPSGAVVSHISHPERWFSTVYAEYAAAYAPEALPRPYLPFSDRRFWLGKTWLFNALVSLRSFHQEAVLGPVNGEPELVPYPAGSGQDQVQKQPAEKQRRFPEGRQF